MRHPILLFDADCNFCRACVRWVVKHDPEGVIHYAPLESEVGKRLLRQHGVPPDQVESVVFFNEGRAYFKSDGVLETIRYLRSRWRTARALRLVPRPIRDFAYERVSQNRPFISRTVGTINRRYEPSGPDRERFLAT